jgi:hypothetical protein
MCVALSDVGNQMPLKGVKGEGVEGRVKCSVGIVVGDMIKQVS